MHSSKALKLLKPSLQVQDMGDGNYSVKYLLPTPGIFALLPTVNGCPVHDSGFTVTASYGALSHQDFELTTNVPAELMAGDALEIAVRVRNVA